LLPEVEFIGHHGRDDFAPPLHGIKLNERALPP
jgi:hypothetical protein